ncbi:MAG: CRISPR-associated endonuclease Cas2 [Pseudarcicella sp.]|nr:CRISPR-associated endonuclease Cas2 [Pseudarcicella sp.]MBP6411284.1 CRISPR-associated endonuclease Cas2 [Pseudarcicella sp.]
MNERLNQYHIMWVFVHFDLPTETPKDRKNYRLFRKSLLDDGFAMLQYSIYVRHCSSRENAEVHKKRIKNSLPKLGEIIIFEITDAQFGRIEFFKGVDPKRRPDTPQQLELF